MENVEKYARRKVAGFVGEEICRVLRKVLVLFASRVEKIRI